MPAFDFATIDTENQYALRKNESYGILWMENAIAFGSIDFNASNILKGLAPFVLFAIMYSNFMLKPVAGILLLSPLIPRPPFLLSHLESRKRLLKLHRLGDSGDTVAFARYLHQICSRP